MTRVGIVLLASPGQVERTLRCLESLARLDADPVHEIVLWIQGGSLADDPTNGELAKRTREAFPEIAIHEHPENLGVASGRNAASRRLLEAPEPPSHLFFLDNDMTVEPDLLARLVEPFAEDPRVALATGKLLEMEHPERLYGAGGCRIRFWRGETGHVGRGEIDRGQYDGAPSSGRLDDPPILPSGGCFFVRADVFEALGGFDEIFSPYGPEDLDFGLRARAAGWEARYAPAAVAYHPAEPGRSFAGGRDDAAYLANRVRQWLRFLHRHAPLRERLAFYFVGAPWLALRRLGRAIRRGQLLAVLRGLLGGLRRDGKSEKRQE